jgi:hypothetical protein
VHHHHEPLLDECGTQCAWIRRTSDWKGPWGYALEEAAMLRRMGPVTEVIEGAPLSEVPPETPEPPQVGCCGACIAKGHVQGEACSDCLGSGHAHDPDDPCPAPEPPREDEDLFPSALAEHCYFEGCPEWITGSSDYCPTHAKSYAPVPASQSVPAVPVSSPPIEDSGEAAETATEALSAVGVGSLSEAIGLALNDTYAGLEFEDPTFESGTMAIMAVLRERLADWRPPLPEVMYDAGETAEEAVRRLAAEVVGLRQQLASPLPDSETEWGWKPDPDEPDEVICSVDEQAARERVSKASYRKLACREVGPWIEVTS